MSAVDRGTEGDLPLLESGDFDLLLSDIVMPEDGRDRAGLSAARRFRPAPKVMFITGFGRASACAPAANSPVQKVLVQAVPPAPILCWKWNGYSRKRAR